MYDMDFDFKSDGERSVSRKLTAGFAKTWPKAHPGGMVISRKVHAQVSC
jgi:FMN-dependent NADH-azoreductase